ncbi:hypothetical protein Acid345_2646 [Candidatus Koribacter versatilis Ellin345]|uniref:Uncharacterized protein n=1 Tax=Koribacter versatilis (strain Ellin345) TaxID=204669 RepID=Q1INA3_KORVE|nr:hypothetical protein [Candidatus Koribacter versatilis]ABF41647.1 hypothetical protein Acid345_2646 [Candidatus Koribacter versatilis Ellin345]
MKKIDIGPAGKLCITFVLAFVATAQSQTTPYPSMAPAEQYQMARDAEISMARSAAPPSVSQDAEILVLGQKGYEVAAKGSNGFTCLVQRSWAAGVDFPEFWNPKLRAPICLNAEATRSILPHFTSKAEWALAGLTKEQIAERIKAALHSPKFPDVEPGAMCYMMSKDQYLNDRAVHWHPHLMFFSAAVDPATWGANLKESPLIADTDKSENVTIFMLTVSKWSDGTPDKPME